MKLTPQSFPEEKSESNASDFVPLNKQLIALKFDLIIFTSKNAVKYFKNECFKSNQVFTIGDGTFKEAIKSRYKNVYNADGNSKDLIKLFINKFKDQRLEILHPTSEDNKQDLKNFFLNHQSNYNRLFVYSSKKIKKNNILIKNFLHSDSGVLTFFSQKTFQNFVEIVKFLKLENKCLNQYLILLSPMLQTELKELRFRKIFLTKKPNEESLLKTINDLSLGQGF